MKKVRIILLAAIILVLWITYRMTGEKGVVAPDEEMTKVTYVFDGDTIEVTGGRRVRYIGVNTPEIAHAGTKEECYGTSAKNENFSLVQGKTVRLVSDISDTDSYGRLLRYVYAGNEFINDTLVRRGFARAEPITPDTEFAQQFFSAQTEAQQNGRGLWSACKSSVDRPQ